MCISTQVVLDNECICTHTDRKCLSIVQCNRRSRVIGSSYINTRGICGDKACIVTSSSRNCSCPLCISTQVVLDNECICTHTDRKCLSIVQCNRRGGVIVSSYINTRGIHCNAGSRAARSSRNCSCPLCISTQVVLDNECICTHTDRKCLSIVQCNRRGGVIVSSYINTRGICGDTACIVTSSSRNCSCPLCISTQVVLDNESILTHTDRKCLSIVQCNRRSRSIPSRYINTRGIHCNSSSRTEPSCLECRIRFRHTIGIVFDDKDLVRTNRNRKIEGRCRHNISVLCLR